MHHVRLYVAACTAAKLCAQQLATWVPRNCQAEPMESRHSSSAEQGRHVTLSVQDYCNMGLNTCPMRRELQHLQHNYTFGAACRAGLTRWRLT